MDVRNHLRGALLSSMIAVLITAFFGVGAQQPGAPSPGGGRGRGASGPPQPTPRLADGTVNLGRVAGEKGVWNVPYITNMAERIVEADGHTYAEKHPPTFGRRGGGGDALGGGEGTTGGGRGG